MHDVEGVEDQLVSDCADDLVPRLAAVDHRPPPLAELRVRATRENRLSGLREEVLDVVATLSVERLAGPAAPPCRLAASSSLPLVSTIGEKPQ